MGHLHFNEAKMSHQVLARKWRPKKFSEVIGQAHVVNALINSLDHDRIHHAFLLTGTRGVGKTTLARIFAKSLNCQQNPTPTSQPCGNCTACQQIDQGRFVDLIEIDAASRTKVEDTREILDNVPYAPTQGRYKVYLIDEVHMLSTSSFNALLKTLEEPPQHVKFILATTDPQKLPATVLSRCLRFHLKKLNHSEIQQQLETLLQSEGIAYEDNALNLIAKAGDGSMRDALSLLDQAIAYSNQNVNLVAVRDMLGAIDDTHILQILSFIAQNNPQDLIHYSHELFYLGVDFSGLLNDIIIGLHTLALLQIDPQLVENEIHQAREQWLEISQYISAEALQLFYDMALHGKNMLKLHPDQRLGFEMTILRMMLFTPSGSAPQQHHDKIPTILTQKTTKTQSAIVSKVNEEFTADISVPLKSSSEIKSETTQPHTSLSAREIALAKTKQILNKTPSSKSQAFPQKPSLKPSLPQASSTTMINRDSVVAVQPFTENEMSSNPDDYSAYLSDATSLTSTTPPITEIIEANAKPNLDPQTLVIPPVTQPIDPLLNEVITSHTHSASTENIVINTENWLEVIGQLKLTGAARELAEHLSLVSIHQQHIDFALSSNLQSFLTEQAENQLRINFRQYLPNWNFSITCQSTSPHATTRAQIKNHQQQAAEQALIDQLKQDQLLHLLQEKLGADLLEESIKVFLKQD